jgi:hypothetical protein
LQKNNFMNNNLTSFLLFFLLFVNIVNAQSVGDTIVVQAIDYSNSSRDLMVNFPASSSVTYEKVVMRYAMRCKNALVSTGTNRNLGCGEWDYSCNTYIHEPSQADSISRTISRYIVAPSSSPTGIYSTVPTWSGIPGVQTSVVLNSTTSEDSVFIGSSSFTDSTFINSRASGKSYVIYTASELISAGMVAGSIDGIVLNSGSSSSVNVNKLRLKLKHSNLANLNQVDTSIFNGVQEVYFHDYRFQSGLNRIQFYNSFNWDGVSNIILECNFEGKDSNSPLYLFSTSGTISLLSINENSAKLFSGNYIEADSYQGIGTNNDRTVEAWIKTTNSGASEITTWGTNSSAQKQSFLVNGSGQLRLEINSAYAVGTKAVNDGQWHHVAFTFSGSNMYDVKFYIDGVWDFSSNVNTKNMNTQLSKLFQISKGFHNRYFSGEIDDVKVWSDDLTAATIQDWMHKEVNATHPNYSSLELNYDFNEASAIIKDKSVNQNNAVFEVTPGFSKINSNDIFKGFNVNSLRPNVIFLQGSYNLTVGSDTIVDTLYNSPYFVTENTVYSKAGSTQTDSIGTVSSIYYPPNNIIYSLAGAVVSNTPSSSTLTLTNQTLDYYQRNPSKLEIMSFVTPYGIGLDFGVDGKAWYFDVTDFLPVLNGSKRMTLERGGQNQEEMDIQFLYIVGTPPAEVKKIQQIWKVDSRGYSDINSDTYFAPRTIKVDTSARVFRLRSAITGHGQQGEFIARNHTYTINNGATVFNKLVWKECADNPVYPQGGTWIYDRAGWCPGMATDVSEYDVSSYVNGDSIQVDYNVVGATGTSNYIVNSQLVSYGNINFQNDARISKVLRPTNETEYGKRNPSCYNPIIIIQNTGSNLLTSATIQIQINGGAPITHSWTGSVGYMNTQNVLIPVTQSFWATGLPGDNSFTATIIDVNGTTDQYVHNNEYKTKFRLADDLPSNINVVLKTNLAASETSYQIKNSSGTIVHQRTNLSNNQTYSDNLMLPADCYQVIVNDLGDDGLSFWANSSGSGYFRLTDQNGTSLTNFNPDFGGGLEYYFTVGRTIGIEDNDLIPEFEIYPNPSDDVVFINSNTPIQSLILINAIGQDVMNKTFNGNTNSYQVNVGDIEPGVYYIKLSTETKTNIQKLIIK